MARKKTASPKHVEPQDESQDIEQEGGGQQGHGFAPGESGTSKTEAIRRAVAAGMETPEDGVNFILKNFGLELSRQHFSTTRSKLKSKEAEGKASAPKGKPGRKPKG